MTKAKAITVLTVISILIVLAAVFAFVSFDIGPVKEYQGYVNAISLGLDLSGGVYAVYSVDTNDEDYQAMSSEDQQAAIQGTADTMEQLLFSKGYTEAQVTVYDTSIRVEVPDVDDPERIFDLIGRPASLWLQGSDSQITDSSAYDADADGMDGSHITNADVNYDSEKSEYVVVLEFDKEGSTRFSELTATYSGKYIAIFANRELLISPSVSSQISDGRCTISGGFDYQSAYDLAVRIMAGTFQAPLNMSESGYISATLGSTAITAGIISGAVGLALIVIYMILLYRLMGVASALSLVYYSFTYLFLLAVFPWVQLTLSGIAGVLLSIGMAVDANVIIFERIKEEYAGGKAINTACSTGFRRSLGAILDGNITTIIGAVVLIIVGSFGAAALKGFGITLLIGLVLSLLCSLILTRLILASIRVLCKDNDTAARLFGLKKSKDDSADNAVKTDGAQVQEGGEA